MNVMSLPNSKRPLELNYMALILAIISSEPLTPEEALDWIIEGKKPEPLNFSPSREVIEKAVKLQKQGYSLPQIKKLLGVTAHITSLCRQLQKYRHYVELDYEPVPIRRAVNKAG